MCLNEILRCLRGFNSVLVVFEVFISDFKVFSGMFKAVLMVFGVEMFVRESNGYYFCLRGFDSVSWEYKMFIRDSKVFSVVFKSVLVVGVEMFVWGQRGDICGCYVYEVVCGVAGV